MNSGTRLFFVTLFIAYSFATYSMDRPIQWVSSLFRSPKIILTQEQEFVKLLDSLWSPENISRLEKLIALGVDVDLKNSSGLTGLMVSVDRDNLNIARQLLHFGANPNIKIEKPLKGCDQKKDSSFEIINLLTQVAEAAEILLQQRNTALFAAVLRSKCDMVRLLLDQGADRTIPNPYGQTVLDVARLNRLTEIADLLSNTQKLL